MKSIFLVLCALMIASFSHSANGFQCYKCDNCPASQTLVDCTGFCKTTNTTTTSSFTVKKECATDCTPSSAGSPIVKCCQTDKCNADPTPISSSTPSTAKKSSIECFTCINCPGSSVAPTTEKLEPCDGYCSKAVGTVNGITSIVKQCLPICPEVDKNGVKISCCKTDKCNGAETVTLNSILSILTLSVIYGFLKF